MREQIVLPSNKVDAGSASGPSLIRFLANWGLGLSGLWQCLPDGLRWPTERHLLALVPSQPPRSGRVDPRKPD